MSGVKFALLALAFSVCALPVHASWIAPFISELHYDNERKDIGEFVAVTGPSGLDLSGWELVLYNGGDGRPYGAIELGGVLEGAASGLAEAAWPFAGIQNGPDAMALVSPLDVVVDFIAYEAGVIATEGAAQDLSARLLSVAEDGGTPAGWSLQRSGTPDVEAWTAAPATPGILNVGLLRADVREVPVAAVATLWSAGAVGWLLTAFGRRRHLGVA